ncbi:MAG: MaoC family dehydratase [Deltaproteobacteria bacterium]|jgi:acyl dehydratase|nr:MaoC family dehydratase [Deltaproteobacteria bacterium]
MNFTSFSTEKEDRYFEDYVAGSVYEFPETESVDEADIIAFARKFDPQYFHTDPEAAARSPYKGIIASGAHTIAIGFKLYVSLFLPGKASFGSPGLDELRWLKPLRPGDAVRVRITILEASPSQSKNDRGTVQSLVEALNQKGETIMSFRCRNIIARRNP